MHPYILNDVANDLTHNGVYDTEKYTREGQKWIEAGLAEDNEIIPVAGVDFVMSTNVPLVANLPVSGKSSWETYITADETMFAIALGGFEDVPVCKSSLIDSKPAIGNEAQATQVAA
jgi:hypothetical protein